MTAAPHPDPPASRPEVRIEPVFRETFLAGFRDPVHADILRLMGDLIHTLTVETFYWLGEECRGVAGMQSDLTAASVDLDHLVDFLQEIGGATRELEAPLAERSLGLKARQSAERLGPMADEMRAAVRAAR